MTEEQKKTVAVFRYGVIAEFVGATRLDRGEREALLKEGIACYQTFLRGLLDLTDNLAEGRIVPPPDVVRHDRDDAYLVVAADKGTASFSDIANGVAAEYGFWLGDAFASGGSAGYDHKAMGITARGAWESVKRHFREMGVDVMKHPFSCIGIGDMSGDVFGNGMLLSKHIRLVGAFSHLHIFVDPDPDPKTSFAERKRLFRLPRSSWTDYRSELISKGGGVFDRRAKAKLGHLGHHALEGIEALLPLVGEAVERHSQDRSLRLHHLTPAATCLSAYVLVSTRHLPGPTTMYGRRIASSTSTACSSSGFTMPGCSTCTHAVS